MKMSSETNNPKYSLNKCCYKEETCLFVVVPPASSIEHVLELKTQYKPCR